jgi:Tol biopolymer transport system component
MIRTLAFLLLAPALLAQGPAHDWRTIELPHFRVHYPVEYQAWATRAAERLEAIRLEVANEIGYTPPQVIDVLVVNPVAEPNGSAWPLLDSPRMILYAEPPGPDEVIGAYGHWIDLLAVHETAHVVHMLRPARNRWERLIGKTVIPLAPILFSSPRWVLEGYATVIEGRLTGAGRPSSTIRALILRRWAENGRLPTYSQLDSDQRFLGMSMAYLMGSAYLEWLERRAGPGSLRSLWARQTARERRSFDEAFIGVFGDSPERLYGQFAAEVTASAMALRRAPLQEGSLFQETSRASGDPAASPDGKQLAFVVRGRSQPERLVIWSTAEAADEEQKFNERIAKILERDPEDVAPVRTKPLARKPVHELTMPDGGDISGPRWTRDGRAILFAHRVPDAEGVLHFDLYRWDFVSLRRITRLADVRDADPIDDQTAIAVRSRFGATELVTVDLATGAVTPRGAASIDTVITHPRVSPDGKRIARVIHQGGRWTLIAGDVPIVLPGDPATPEWISNDELLVTVFLRGFAELHRVSLDGKTTGVTRAGGGAFQPAPSSDGRAFFMSLEPDGFVLRVLEALTAAPALPSYDASLVPALPPVPASPSPASGPAGFSPPDSNRLAEARRSTSYGIGRQELSWLSSGTYAPGQRSMEVGVRLGDVVGRLDTLLVASFATDNMPQGVALSSAWRGWPVELHGHLHRAEDDDGGELRARWARRFPLSRLTIEGGASDELVFASGAFSTRQHFASTRLDASVRVEIDEEHYRVVLGGAARVGSLRLAARYQHDAGATVTLGGASSAILPRSRYALRILDPALPASILAADQYDGWRVETTLPGVPLNAFYQRHELGGTRLSLAGVEGTLLSEPFPILKAPGLELGVGVARVLDAPVALDLRGDTKWWLTMRWRP